MRILITGAGGRLGRKLVSKTDATDYHLKLLIREKEAVFSETPADIIIGDLLDKASLTEAVKDIDTVIHLAGLTHTNDQESYYRVNTLGTKNLLEACRKARIKRFIFISSRAAGLSGGAYAKSKFLAEEAVKKSGLDWVILRLAEVYGAGESEAVGKLIKIIRSGYFVPIIGSGKFLLAPIFLDDAIDGILTVLNNSALNGKTYNLAGPEEITYNELVNKIMKAMGLKRIKIFLPIVFIKMALGMLSLIGINVFVKDQLPRLLSAKSSDISQAAGDFNFRPRNFETGLMGLLSRENQALC